MDLYDLQTPALVLDRGILARNARAMTQRVRDLGVRLRPHLKTAKSVDAARVALDGNFGGITVSTLNEAAYFLDHSITDITYAVGMAPGKLDVAAALMDRGADLKIITDDPSAARAIADHGAPFKVLIEIDVGDHRGGLVADADEVVEIGRMIGEAPAAALEGVLTHAGQSYACRDPEAMAAVAERERAGVVIAAKRLEGAGLRCSMVSVGSTPTARFARDLSGPRIAGSAWSATPMGRGPSVTCASPRCTRNTVSSPAGTRSRSPTLRWGPPSGCCPTMPA
jgi:D-serine deaminase-like pyridoxal phosphate-dependent protein